MSVMNAMILHRESRHPDDPLRLETVQRPTPGESDILIRVHACGVCRTDLHIIDNELIPPIAPLIPGHQIVGTVERVGTSDSRFRPGDRVGVAWLHHTCGQCVYCDRGDENLCPSAKFTGFHVPGGFAEYVTIDENFAYPLTLGLPDERIAPLMCAGIIGYRALRMSGVQPGGHLGLYGFGASAHITLQIAKHRGINVYVFSRTESHRRFARGLGATWAGSAKQSPPIKLNGSIVFAPAGPIVPPALEHLDRGGTCMLAGICMTAIPELDYDKHLYNEKNLQTVTASTRRDGREFFELATAIPVETQVTVFALADANAAVRSLKSGKIDGAAVLHISDP